MPEPHLPAVRDLRFGSGGGWYTATIRGISTGDPSAWLTFTMWPGRADAFACLEGSVDQQTATEIQQRYPERRSGDNLLGFYGYPTPDENGPAAQVIIDPGDSRSPLGGAPTPRERVIVGERTPATAGTAPVITHGWSPGRPGSAEPGWHEIGIGCIGGPDARARIRLALAPEVELVAESWGSAANLGVYTEPDFSGVLGADATYSPNGNALEGHVSAARYLDHVFSRSTTMYFTSGGDHVPPSGQSPALLSVRRHGDDGWILGRDLGWNTSGVNFPPARYSFGFELAGGARAATADGTWMGAGKGFLYVADLDFPACTTAVPTSIGPRGGQVCGPVS